MFVYGSNDLYSPVPKNPARYIWKTSADEHKRHVPDLPWAELGASLEAAGWMNANNRRGRVKVGDFDIEVAGVHDSHISRDRYAEVAGPADPAADLRLGVMHSPEPAVMDRFVADGFDLLLAGSHPRRPDLPARLRHARDQLRHRPRPGAGPAPAPVRPRSAPARVPARIGRSRHVPLCPGTAGLPSGGHRAHARPADGLDSVRGRRGVAQLGSALRSGRRGRRFKSGHPDQFTSSDACIVPGYAQVTC